MRKSEGNEGLPALAGIPRTDSAPARPQEAGHGFDLHSRRTAWLAERICLAMGLERALTKRIVAGSYLHDLGKRFIARSILDLPRPLTPEERRVVERHSPLGSSLLRRIAHELDLDIDAEIEILRSHHERWDGRGYPDRLRREAIPLGARVTAVADAFDALATARPYKEAWPLESVFAYIQGHTGRRFDPLCVDSLLLARWQITDSFERIELSPEGSLPRWVAGVRSEVELRWGNVSSSAEAHLL